MLYIHNPSVGHSLMGPKFFYNSYNCSLLSDYNLVALSTQIWLYHTFKIMYRTTLHHHVICKIYYKFNHKTDTFHKICRSSYSILWLTEHRHLPQTFSYVAKVRLLPEHFHLFLTRTSPTAHTYTYTGRSNGYFTTEPGLTRRSLIIITSPPQSHLGTATSPTFMAENGLASCMC